MARLIKLSNTSWKQPFKDRNKEIYLWGTNVEVAKYCNIEDGTKRLLNIKFEDEFDIDETDYFQITSGREISFPKSLREKVQNVIFNNPNSYFIVTVMDCKDASINRTDIRWLKNIKRNQGEEWAYDDTTCKNTFLLNWPSKKKGSASTPKTGDIILLFQRPNKVHNKRNYKVYLTHLVTPISKDIIIDHERPSHQWCREVQIIAMANPIDAIPNPGYFNFFLANRGLTNPIINLENDIGLSEAETKKEIWRLFNRHLCIQKRELNPDTGNPIGVFGELEGGKVIKEHLRQELAMRNPKIVLLAKEFALKKGNGRIKCECCNFDFIGKYGDHGFGFIECHHKIPISKGQRITEPKDLALVCSNCHRMLHRKNRDEDFYTVEELKEIVKKE